tara:strand:- start:345 stop:788 length:444 start_codon:yes stop_codon:yes gene_type:complete
MPHGVEMSDKTNIFANEHNESAVQTIRSTMAVQLDDNGTPVISFATNRGKGSGAQVMPVSEYREYVETLGEYAEHGIPESTEEEQLSPSETVRRTIKQDDGILSFRVRSGKGAKPARLPTSDFSEVVELLRDTVDAVESAGKQLGGE